MSVKGMKTDPTAGEATASGDLRKCSRTGVGQLEVLVGKLGRQRVNPGTRGAAAAGLKTHLVAVDGLPAGTVPTGKITALDPGRQLWRPAGVLPRDTIVTPSVDQDFGVEMRLRLT